MSQTEAITTSDAGESLQGFPQFDRPHDLIAALRAARGETLDVFGKMLGVSSKGRMSEIERGQVTPTPEQALALEELSGGQIDASALNPIIAKARGAEWCGDHGAADTSNVAQSSRGKAGDNFPALRQAQDDRDSEQAEAAE